ncbi:hypothetical protein AB0K47_28840 [Streptomyces tirandamycinicus]|uniref:hypothetical protein n=1 Tax=Streptomyces tirandamycinicus TaxID=2174846 RepID=UPI0034298A05
MVEIVSKSNPKNDLVTKRRTIRGWAYRSEAKCASREVERRGSIGEWSTLKTSSANAC